MNTGKSLEDLVRQIESALAPSGISVEANDKVFNDDGVQVAEFDIIISGTVGSASIRWLIECRDRPSVGAAPLSWVEQLYGRRAFHNFDKVFAVSTTGFAPGAADFANKHGIHLRVVKSVSELASDFQMLSSSEISPQVEFLEIRCFTYYNEDGREKLVLRNPLFRTNETRTYQDILSFALEFFNLPDQIDEENLYHCCVYCREPIEIYSDSELLRFAHLGFELKLRLKVEKMPILVESMKSYEEDGRVIGQEVQASMTSSEGKLSTQVLIAHKPDGTFDIGTNASAEGNITLYGEPKLHKRPLKDEQ